MCAGPSQRGRSELDAELTAAITTPMTRGGGLLTRQAGVGLVLAPSGQPDIRLRKGDPVVTIAGPIGECVLYVYGRKDHARVHVTGPDDAVATVHAASFGI